MEQLIEQNLINKWQPILEHSSLPEITDLYKKSVTAALLENQQNNKHLNEAAPTNGTDGISKWDPVLIGLVRRAVPQMVAFDIAGVQPMSMPTGLIFALRARYNGQTGDEALFYEADTAFGGTGTHVGNYPFIQVAEATTGSDNADTTLVLKDEVPGLVKGVPVLGKDKNGKVLAGVFVESVTGTTVTLDKPAEIAIGSTISFGAGTGTSMDTKTGEGDISKQMGVTIEKISAEAGTRALKAEYSIELAQDMSAVHGLDAESELANILATEILSEINREFLRTLYNQAKIGALGSTIPGVFDLDKDADGRWNAEKFKGLHFAIERDANAVAVETRRGKGNILVVSPDVASALAMANVLSYSVLDTDMNSDWTQSTFVGTIGGRMKVFVDPYATANFYMVGYKGASPFDAGYFYCPYIPLQLYKAVDQASFQPKIAFKTRYAMVANPLFNNGMRQNGYYRIAGVTGV